MKNIFSWLVFTLAMAWVIFGCLALFGCSATVHPKDIQPNGASIVAGVQDSGVGQIVTGGSYVPAEWVVNYNQGVEDYGTDPFFKHHLVKNEGITIEEDGRYFATDEAHHNYAMFATWRRNKTHQPKSAIQKAVGL
jgi:hypothetical protein